MKIFTLQTAIYGFTSFDECTYCKSLWLKASATRPECERGGTWKRICAPPLSRRRRRPRKVQSGSSSSTTWLETTSKRWNHQGERCR